MTSRFIVRRRARGLRRHSQDAEYLSGVETIGRQLRSGASLSTALRVDARQHGHEWSRAIVRTLDEGSTLANAVESRLTTELHRRRPDSDLVLTLQVLAMAADVGGESSRHIDALIDTLRSRRRAAADRLTQASTALASIRLLTWLPAVCALWMVVDDPDVRRVLVGSPIGWICLAAGATFNVIGRHWTSRLVHQL